MSCPALRVWDRANENNISFSGSFPKCNLVCNLWKSARERAVWGRQTIMLNVRAANTVRKTAFSQKQTVFKNSMVTWLCDWRNITKAVAKYNGTNARALFYFSCKLTVFSGMFSATYLQISHQTWDSTNIIVHLKKLTCWVSAELAYFHTNLTWPVNTNTYYSIIFLFYSILLIKKAVLD